MQYETNGWVLLAIALPTFLFAFGCMLEFFTDVSFDIDDFSYRFSDEFLADLGGVGKLEVDIHNCTIRTEVWDQERLEVRVLELIKAPSREKAEDVAKEIKLVNRGEGETVKLVLDLGSYAPRLDNGHNYDEALGYACELDIRLPRRMNLKFSTHNGSIDVPLSDGSADLASHNGAIAVGRCGADAYLLSHNGKIRFESVGGDLEADSHNGDLLGGAVSGEARLTSHNGDIEIGPVGRSLKADTHNGSIRIEGAGGPVECNSHDGDIALVLKGNAGVSIDATGRRVDCDLPLENVRTSGKRPMRFEGSYNGGGHRVVLNTHSGSIRIEKE